MRALMAVLVHVSTATVVRRGSIVFNGFPGSRDVPRDIAVRRGRGRSKVREGCQNPARSELRDIAVRRGRGRSKVREGCQNRARSELTLGRARLVRGIDGCF